MNTLDVTIHEYRYGGLVRYTSIPITDAEMVTHWTLVRDRLAVVSALKIRFVRVVDYDVILHVLVVDDWRDRPQWRLAPQWLGADRDDSAWLFPTQLFSIMRLAESANSIGKTTI
jgi:hypothetical protein